MALIGGCGAEHVTQRKKHFVKRDHYRLFFISATNYGLPERRRAWAVASPLCSSWEFLMPFSPSAFYQVSRSDLTVGFLGIASDAIQLLCLAEMKRERFQVSQSNCTRLCPDWNKFSKSYNTNINRDRQMTVVKEQIAACSKFECLRK